MRKFPKHQSFPEGCLLLDLKIFFQVDEVVSKLRTMNSPGWVVQLVGESSHTPKGPGFHSQSRHISSLWVPYQHVYGRKLIDVFHISVSHSPFLFLSKSA